jgi:hypothetical protein
MRLGPILVIASSGPMSNLAGHDQPRRALSPGTTSLLYALIPYDRAGAYPLTFRTSRFRFDPPFHLVDDPLAGSAAFGLTKQDLAGSC